jgi:hypothetical protein
MGIECGTNFGFRIELELGIAAFTHPENWRGSFNQAEFSLRHEPSLPLQPRK